GRGWRARARCPRSAAPRAARADQSSESRSGERSSIPANLDAGHVKVYIWIAAWPPGFSLRGHGPDAGSEAQGRMTIEHDLYFICMAARLLDMHPQTLRKYERLGLVRPTRTVGSMRVYSREELDRLKVIKHLVEDEGVNLAGVQRLLPLMQEGASKPDVRKRVALEIERIGRTVGI